MKKAVLAGFAAFLGLVAAGRTPLERLFVSAPSQVLPLLAANDRLDMLDLYDYKMEAKAGNWLGGTSKLTAKNDAYLKLRLTESSEWEVRLLTTGADSLLVVVHTLLLPTPVSRLHVYDTRWQLRPDTVPSPVFDDFWVGADSLPLFSREQWCDRLTPLPVEAHWAEATAELTYRVTFLGLDADSRQKAPALFRPLVYGWRDGRWLRKD